MILVGTCSWSEKTLIKSKEFYPKGVNTAEERLKYYSGHFATVEVDSSYYAIPEERTVALWADRTPESFIFHIKAYSALTGHGTDIRTLPKDFVPVMEKKAEGKGTVYIKDEAALTALAGRLKENLAPLRKAGKLGLLVFQYPPWFQYSSKNLDHMLFCKDIVSPLPLAVEFRHGSWLKPERREPLFSFLEKNRITYITADEPQYGTLSTVPFVPFATTDTAYLRLHGRNRENWLKKGVETSLRYDYFYDENELMGFKPHILGLDKKARSTFVMFNNCHGGFAVKDALKMKELLKGQS